MCSSIIICSNLDTKCFCFFCVKTAVAKCNKIEKVCATFPVSTGDFYEKPVKILEFSYFPQNFLTDIPFGSAGQKKNYKNV